MSSKKSSKVKDAATGVEVAVPSAPKRLSAYQLFVKARTEEFRARHPDKKGPEILALMAAAWGRVGADEKAALEARADRDLQRKTQDWDAGRDEREFERMGACKKLGLALNTSWATLVEEVRRRNPPAGGAKKPVAAAAPKRKVPAAPANPADARAARARARSWQACFMGPARRKSIIAGLDAIFAMAADAQNFDHFGNDMIQCFYDIAVVTEDPVRDNALMFVEQLARRWRHDTLAGGWRVRGGARPSPQNILETVIGVYCMERVGVSCPTLKADVLHAARRTGPDAPRDGDDAPPYGARDYLGWDPRTAACVPEGVPEVLSGEAVSVYRTLCNSLIHSFYAQRAGVDVGAAYHEVLKHVDGLRPYKGPGDLPWDDYVDQCYLVTHVVFTLNNWGELRLEPGLLPHEHLFVREHLGTAIRERDVHLAGEYVECLRCFGAPDADPQIQLGLQFLLQAQDGATRRWDVESDNYTSYHATMVACQALLVHTYRGFGPGLADCAPVLDAWAGGGEHPDAALIKAVAEPPPPPPKREKPPSPRAAAPAPAKKRPSDGPAPEKKKKKKPPPEAPAPKPDKPRVPSPAPLPKAKPPALAAADVAAIEAELKAAVAASEWPAATKLLKRLSDGGVSVDLLKSTSVGKTVATLKKAGDAKLAMAAKALVARWKQMVRDAGDGS